MCFLPFYSLVFVIASFSSGLLYPKDSTSRLVKELNGIWHFRVDNSASSQEGFTEEWYSKPLQSVSIKLYYLSVIYI